MFEPLRPAGGDLARLPDWPGLGDFAKLPAGRDVPMTTRSGLPVALVAQGPKPREMPDEYEPRIYLKGEVQTRVGSWHDLFNALVWLTFPNTKAALNEIHWRELQKERSGAGKLRGAARDAAAQFDESGVIVACADAELAALLTGFEWKELFWRRRARVGTHMQFYLFGHGLYEKALHPFVGMTGKGIILPVERDFFELPLEDRLSALDAAAAVHFEGPDGIGRAGDLAPVPVLGYPGWSEDNDAESYYDNTRYFRPGRRGAL